MDTLTQKVQIDLSGGGTLPKTLADAKQQAQDLGKQLTANAATATAKLPTSAGAATGGAVDNSALASKLKVISSLYRQQADEEAQAAQQQQSTLKSMLSVIGSLHKQQAAEEQAAAQQEQNALASKLTVVRSLYQQQVSEAKEFNDKLKNLGKWGFAAGVGAAVALPALSNPWTADRFAKASADFAAVIGRDLVPILETMTKVVRFAADAWVALPAPLHYAALGAVGLTIAAGGLIVVNGILTSSTVTSALAIGAETIAKIRASAATLTLTGAVTAMGTAITAAAGWIIRHPLIAAAVALGAVATYNAFQHDASYGAAVRPVGITSAAGYLEELQLDTLRAGKTEQEKTNSILEDIKGLLSEGKGIKGSDGKVWLGPVPGAPDKSFWDLSIPDIKFSGGFADWVQRQID